MCQIDNIGGTVKVPLGCKNGWKFTDYQIRQTYQPQSYNDFSRQSWARIDTREADSDTGTKIRAIRYPIGPKTTYS